MIKRLLLMILVAGLAAGAVYWTRGQQGSGQKQAFGRRGGDGPVPVLVADARRGAFDLTLEGVGTARARNSVTVKPQVDGKILSINFKEGQDVRKGDLLAKIDPASYQAQLDQALAKKNAGEVQLANARADLERYDKVGPGVVAQKTIDTQRALVSQLAAQVKQDDAAIANAKTFLDYTDIRAPLDGRTGLRLVDAGNLVRSGDAGIVTITEVKPISVVFTLPQQTLGQINAATARGVVEAVALLPDGKGALDTGTLQVLDNQVDQLTGTIKLKAEFPNANLQLWPGQFVNVRIKLQTLQQVVIVPTPAIQRGPSGTFVFVAGADDTVSMRQTAALHQTETEAVVDKVNEGERVVTSGFGRLQQGAKIVVAAPDAKSGAPAAEQPKGEETSQVRPQGFAPAVAAEAEPNPAQANERARDGSKRGEHRRKREANGG